MDVMEKTREEIDREEKLYGLNYGDIEALKEDYTPECDSVYALSCMLKDDLLDGNVFEKYSNAELSDRWKLVNQEYNKSRQSIDSLEKQFRQIEKEYDYLKSKYDDAVATKEKISPQYEMYKKEVIKISLLILKNTSSGNKEK